MQSEAAKAAGLPVEKVIANNHLLGGGFAARLEPDMVVAAVRVPSRSTARSRWCGPAKKTSSTTSTVRSTPTPLLRRCPTARSSAGNIGSAARPSWRAGCRRPSRKASTSTRSIARSTCPTTFPTSTSNMSGPSHRRCRPDSGAGSVPTTMCLRSNASWTSWHARRARIRSPSAAPCSGKTRVCWPRLITWRKNPAGASHYRRALAAASRAALFASFIATVVEAE